VQRSVRSGSGSIPEAKYAKLLHFATSDEFTEREKVALTYTSAIVWESSIADDTLWERLHEYFTDAELVELGFFVGLTLGQQRWIKTLGIGHRELLADTEGGLASAEADKG
jgi:alkylhydroperoxidase family enzyme